MHYAALLPMCKPFPRLQHVQSTFILLFVTDLEKVETKVFPPLCLEIVGTFHTIPRLCLISTVLCETRQQCMYTVLSCLL